MALMLLCLSKKQLFLILDELSAEAQSTQSVNTIYLKNNKYRDIIQIYWI